MLSWGQLRAGNFSSLLFLICLTSLFNPNLQAQSGATDRNFADSSRFFHFGLYDQYESYSVALQPDGKILVPGKFLRTIDSRSICQGLIRLAANGSLDSSFLCDTFQTTLNFRNDESIDLVRASGSAIYCRLNKYLVKPQLLRLNPDGTIDTSFSATNTPGQKLDGYLIRENGKILCWGDAVYQLNADGSSDPTFTTTTFPSTSTLSQLLPAPNGKIYLLRQDTTQDYSSSYHLSRLNPDGTADTTFTSALPSTPPIQHLEIDPSGTLLAVLVSESRPTLVRVKTDGSLDAAFQSQLDLVGSLYLGFPTYPNINHLVVTSTGKILLHGAFVSVRGVARTGLAMLNADGSLDTQFVPTLPYDPQSNLLNQIHPLPDGKILLGGKFTLPDASTSVPLMRLLANGQIDPNFTIMPENADPNLGHYAASMFLLQPDGNILCAQYEPAPEPIPGGGIIIGVPQQTNDYPSKVVRYSNNDNQPPHRPTTVTVTSPDSSTTHIAWNDVLGETGYTIERYSPNPSTGLAEWTTVGTVNANVTSWDDTQLIDTVNRHYRVLATNIYGASLPSPGTAILRPTAFSTVTMQGFVPHTVSLSWTPVTGHWQYEIYRTLGMVDTSVPPTTVQNGDGLPGTTVDWALVYPPGTVLSPGNIIVISNDTYGYYPTRTTGMTQIATLPSNSTSYSDTTVEPGRQYSYIILARNTAGSVETAPRAVTVPVTTAPTAPDRASAGAGMDQSLVLSWQDGGLETGYRIERSLDGLTGWQTLAELAANTNTYSDTLNLPAGQTFTYRITATNPVGPSPSTLVHATVLDYNVVPAGTLDPSFNLSPWNGGAIGAHPDFEIKSSPSGDLYFVRGYYDNQKITRLSPDGTLTDLVTVPDITAFLPLPNGNLIIANRKYGDILEGYDTSNQRYFSVNSARITALCALKNGKILTVGYTLNYTTKVSAIQRLNANGQIDTTFTVTGLPTDFGAPTRALEQSNGKLIVFFDSSYVVRLNPNGALDLTFGTNGFIKAFSNGAPLVAILQADDRILLGGSAIVHFESYTATVFGGIVRLTPDGHLDPTFSSGSGFSGPLVSSGIYPPPPDFGVTSLTNDTQGRILVGGCFNRYDSIGVPPLVRLLPDGTLDASFRYDPGTGTTIVSTRNLIQMPDGTLYALCGTSPDGQIPYNYSTYVNRYFTEPTEKTSASALTRTIQSSSTFTLNWEADNASSFDIQTWNPATKQWELLTTTTSTQYTIQGQSPGAHGSFRVIKHLPDQTTLTTPSIIGRTYTLFENWKVTHGLDAAAPAHLDTNSLGVPLLLKYAFDLDVNHPEMERLPFSEIKNNQLNYTYRKVRPELTYVVEYSTDLVNWTTQNITETAGPESSEITATIPGELGAQKFIRVRVVSP